MDVDGEDFGLRLLWLVFVSDGPTRCFASLAEFALVGEAVHLDDGTIGLVGQRFALFVEFANGREQAFGAVGMPDEICFAQSDAVEQRMHVSLGLNIAGFDEAIEDDVERTFGHDLRIEQLQGACGGVARVREALFTGFVTFLVEFGKACLGHEDLATHFKSLRNVFRQAQGQCLNGFEVVGDVVAGLAITACRRLFEHAIFVAHSHSDTIDLRLDDAVDALTAQTFLQAGEEGAEFLFGVGVVEAHHAHGVRDLREAFQRSAADTLRGRIGRQQIGKLRFDVL